MIRRTTFLAFIFLTLFTGGILFQTIIPSNEKKGIEEVLTQELSIPEHETRFPCKQTRSGVVKDLWINDREKSRLHHHIESPHSILTAIPHGNRIELIEKMVGMKCFFQERVEGGEEAQQVRYLESEEGTYWYTSQHFDADQVFLALFHLPGFSLSTQLEIEKAYLKGVAKQVSLSFSHGSPSFHAETFKAHIHPQGKKQ